MINIEINEILYTTLKTGIDNTLLEVMIIRYSRLYAKSIYLDGQSDWPLPIPQSIVDVGGPGRGKIACLPFIRTE